MDSRVQRFLEVTKTGKGADFVCIYSGKFIAYSLKDLFGEAMPLVVMCLNGSNRN